eukprot:2055717-Amphidinium_carterae.1
MCRGVNKQGRSGRYAAKACFRHAMIETSRRTELADAIADNIVMVAISKKVWDMQTGHLYRERLPKAIVDVSQEHGFDPKQLRVQFRLHVR